MSIPDVAEGHLAEIQSLSLAAESDSEIASGEKKSPVSTSTQEDPGQIPSTAQDLIPPQATTSREVALEAPPELPFAPGKGLLDAVKEVCSTPEGEAVFRRLYSDPFVTIKHVAAYVITTSGELIVQKSTDGMLSKGLIQAFGGCNFLNTVVRMLNSLRLELMDEGCLVTSSPLFVRASDLYLVRRTLVQVFVFKPAIKELFQETRRRRGTPQSLPSGPKAGSPVAKHEESSGNADRMEASHPQVETVDFKTALNRLTNNKSTAPNTGGGGGPLTAARPTQSTNDTKTVKVSYPHTPKPSPNLQPGLKPIHLFSPERARKTCCLSYDFPIRYHRALLGASPDESGLRDIASKVSMDSAGLFSLPFRDVSEARFWRTCDWLTLRALFRRRVFQRLLGPGWTAEQEEACAHLYRIFGVADQEDEPQGVGTPGVDAPVTESHGNDTIPVGASAELRAPTEPAPKEAKLICLVRYASGRSDAQAQIRSLCELFSTEPLLAPLRKAAMSPWVPILWARTSPLQTPEGVLAMVRKPFIPPPGSTSITSDLGSDSTLASSSSQQQPQ